MFESAADRLAADAAALDRLNVFPVPDGDTGTNLLHTMRAALAEARGLGGAGQAAAAPASASAIAAAAARGALEGARGNSGIILSQFFRGLAVALEDRAACVPADVARAFALAEAFARAGISRPAEGTILTVLADVARALAATPRDVGAALDAVLRDAVAAAAASVERSPSLLAVLRDAGVVDAGARGMLRVLEGFLEALGDGVGPVGTAGERPPAEAPQRTAHGGRPYGFCTEFLLTGDELALDALRARLEREGSSVILVGDARAARVHVHTRDPQRVLSYARTLGTVSRLVLQDMDHAAASGGPAAQAGTKVVAVLEGEGFAAIAASLGATVVAAADAARALEGTAAERVLVVAPGEAVRGVVRAASAAAGARVVTVAGEPRAVAALVAWRPDAGVEENVEAMTRAAARVATVEVRDADDAGALRAALAAAARERRPDAVTVYRGAGAAEEAAGRVADACRSAFPGADVRVAAGGQACPPLLVALE